MAAYRAVESICHGTVDIRPGDLVPATDTDLFGNETQVDFERLLALGVVELDEPKRARGKKAAAGEAEPEGSEPAGDASSDAPAE